MSAFDTPWKTADELSDELGQHEQNALNRVRYNTAINAATRMYGDVFSDPTVAKQAQDYGQAQQMNPLKVQEQTDANTTTELANTQTSGDQQRMAVYRAAGMLANSADPQTGAVSPDAFDKVIAPNAQLLGIDPAHLDTFKATLTAPGGRQYLQQLQQSMLGPAKVTGAPTQVLNPDGTYGLVEHDQYGRLIQPQMPNGAQPSQAVQGGQRATQGGQRVQIQQNNSDINAYRAGTTANNSLYGAAPGTSLPAQGGVQGSAAPAGAQPPLGVRSNNPLNLQPGGQEAKFGNMTAGVLAAANQLDQYDKSGNDTVSGIVTKWAPPTDAKGKVINDTASYITNVAKKLGVDPGAHLDLSDPNTKGALIEAMAAHENGQPLNSGSGQQAQQSQSPNDLFNRLPPRGQEHVRGMAQSLANQTSMLDTTNKILATVKQQLGPYTTAVGYHLLKDLPGSVQKDIQENIATLNGQGLLAAIQGLKNANGQTGIGRLNLPETGALQKSFGSLDPNQSIGAMMQHLNYYSTQLNQFNKNARTSFQSQWGRSPEAAVGLPERGGQGGYTPSQKAVLSKYGL